jgi:hypothetical protein
VAAFRRAASCSCDNVDTGMALLVWERKSLSSGHPLGRGGLKRVDFEASKPRAKESMKWKRALPAAPPADRLGLDGIGHGHDSSSENVDDLTERDFVLR